MAGATNPDFALWDIVIGDVRLTAFPSFPGDTKLMAPAFAVKYQRGRMRKG